MYAASYPLNRVLSGTTTAPARCAPSAANTHSAMFGAHTPIRSPGWMLEPTNARAARSIRCASSSKLSRSSPSTSASAPPKRRAADSTTPGMVSGSREWNILERIATDARPAAITDDAIDRLRARINVPEPWAQPPHYRVITADTFRLVAEAYGDDNPLWCDPAYGETTRWGGPIAPPPLVGGDTLVGDDEVTEIPDDMKSAMRGDPLRGVHAFYASS